MTATVDSVKAKLAAALAEADAIPAPVPDPPPPPVPAGKVPVLGNSHMHQQQNWFADWIDPVVAKGRALPWTIGADLPNGVLAFPKKGVAPSVVHVWHVFGNSTGLYSSWPYVDPQGRSHPYSPQTSDDFEYITADLRQRPPPDGPRGLAMLSPYTTILPHPTLFPAADVNIAKPAGAPNTGVIPRHPLVLWLRHDGLLQLAYADGRVRSPGFLPGMEYVHDACFDGRFMAGTLLPDGTSVRKFIYVCDLGEKVAGKWTGGRIARVNRTPGSEAIGGTPQEDPSKYLVTKVCDAGYPTGICSDETGALFFIDGDAPGAIFRIDPDSSRVSTLASVPLAFAIAYANGKLYVMSADNGVRIVDAKTGAVGPNLMPAAYAQGVSARGADYYRITVDANGTIGPVGRFFCSRVHGGGNVNTWAFSPDGSVCQFGIAIFNSGKGRNTCGDIRWVNEIAHYDWTAIVPHVDQGIAFAQGYGNVAPTVIVVDPAVPAQSEVDYTAIYRGTRTLCRGGVVDDRTRPSLTCLMSREGWSMFAGCSNDEIAEMGFDAAEAWIHGGYAGSFRRDDIVGMDLYGLMLLHMANSQRHIREGAAFIAAFNAWWKAKHGAITFPAQPYSAMKYLDSRGEIREYTSDESVHRDKGSPSEALRLEVRETAPGAYRIGIFGVASNDIRYTTQQENPGPPPADAVIVVDQGTPQEMTLPGTLSSGWHAFTVRASGWMTGATTYRVP